MRNQLKAVPEPVQKFKSLRDGLLSAFWRSSGFSPTEANPHIWALLMEVGYPETVVTLVCTMDGEVNLYFGSGGGVLGGRDHESLRAKAQNFFLAAETLLPKLNPTKTFPLPEIDRVRFYVRTFGETYTTQVNRANIDHENHELYPLFRTGHEVIAALRELDEAVKLPRLE